MCTMSTYNRSSSMSASCMSMDSLSMFSCFSRSFPFEIAGAAPILTREFSGARTNEVSAMKDGSGRVSTAWMV